jgi:uncharacterized protein involved in exopolysaccharide biosynthesis
MRILFSVIVCLIGFGAVPAQRPAVPAPCEAKTTAAYATLVLRKVALQAEIEGDLATASRDNPAVKAKQTELDTVARELDQLCTVTHAKQVFLNENYGRLMLHKVELAARLRTLLERYTPEWPEAKRTRAELTALEREMAKIMQ